MNQTLIHWVVRLVTSSIWMQLFVWCSDKGCWSWLTCESRCKHICHTPVGKGRHPVPWTLCWSKSNWPRRYLRRVKTLWNAQFSMLWIRCIYVYAGCPEPAVVGSRPLFSAGITRTGFVQCWSEDWWSILTCRNLTPFWLCAAAQAGLRSSDSHDLFCNTEQR